MEEASDSSVEPRASAFPPTRWTLVLDAHGDDPSKLAELCRAYWYPLYCYARRLRPEPEDAKDLTQAFFATLLSRQSLRLAQRERGKLRSFLLTALLNFSREDHRQRQAQKRGQGAVHVPWDELAPEERFPREADARATPEVEFDRAWARELLASVLERLGQAYREAGKGEVFAALQDQLAGGGTEAYASAAQALGLSPAAVRYAAFKLRERYREMLLAAIRETVTSEAEAEEELAHLKSLFARP